MAILWAGTSLADYTINGVTAANTVAARIATTVVEGVGITESSRAVSPQFAPVSELWFSGFVYISTYSFQTQVLFYVNGPGNTNLFAIRAHDGGAWSLNTWWNSNWFELVRGAILTPAGVRYRIDVHCKFDATDGFIFVYRDGALILSYEGDTSSSSGTIARSFSIGTAYSGSTVTSGSVHSANVVADEDTRKFTFVQRLPISNGAEADWTGSYADIDETGINDADYITTETVGEVSTFNYADIPTELAVRNVAALVISGRARSAGGISEIQGVARIGGVDYTASGEFDASAIYGPQNWVFNANPATGEAWIGSDIDAAEFGVKAA